MSDVRHRSTRPTGANRHLRDMRSHEYLLRVVEQPDSEQQRHDAKAEIVHRLTVLENAISRIAHFEFNVMASAETDLQAIKETAEEALRDY